MSGLSLPNFLKDCAIPEREIPIMAVEKPVDAVREERNKMLHKANIAETVRLAGNWTPEEQAAVLTIMDEKLIAAELEYRRALRDITFGGYEEISERYRNARRQHAGADCNGS